MYSQDRRHVTRIQGIDKQEDMMDTLNKCADAIELSLTILEDVIDENAVDYFAAGEAKQLIQTIRTKAKTLKRLADKQGHRGRNL